VGGQGWEKGCTERSQDLRLLGMAFVRVEMAQGNGFWAHLWDALQAMGS
jgi:hypothetical protein